MIGFGDHCVLSLDLDMRGGSASPQVTVGHGGNNAGGFNNGGAGNGSNGGVAVAGSVMNRGNNNSNSANAYRNVVKESDVALVEHAQM
jgi:hypothetical protein